MFIIINIRPGIIIYYITQEFAVMSICVCYYNNIKFINILKRSCGYVM